MTKLRISPDLALPGDTVTSTLIVYGGKGMGKTNLGNVLAEEIAKAGQRFSVIDPLGVWWGLAFSADGKGAGVPFVGLGGPKGDIPITPHSGSIVADFVADEAVSTVITLVHADGRMWSVGERIRFVADYTYRLFERQGDGKVPLMQIIDEAGRFVPQQIPAGSPDIARCVGGIEQLTEWGRNVAVGVTLITQRSARMNKSVSELADAMIAFRTVGPRSIDAIVDWLGEHVARSRTNEIVESLRELPVGTALVISPGWLGLERVVAMRARETFDSSATPTGAQAAAPRGPGSKPDLEKYRERMAATIEEAEAKDPAKLRRRIAQLEAEAKARDNMPVSIPERLVEMVVERVEVPVLTSSQLDELRKLAASVHEHGWALINAVGFLTNAIEGATPRPAPKGSTPVARARETLVRPEAPPAADRPGIARPRETSGLRGSDAAPERVRPEGAGDASFAKAERQVLAALAEYPIGLTRKQLAFLANYHPNAKSLVNALGSLRSAGLITAGFPAQATAEGAAVGAGFIEARPDNVLDTWLSRFGRPERAILSRLIEIYPAPAERAELGVVAGYEHPNSKGYVNALGRLRGLGLVDGFALDADFAALVGTA